MKPYSHIDSRFIKDVNNKKKLRRYFPIILLGFFAGIIYEFSLYIPEETSLFSSDMINLIGFFIVDSILSSKCITIKMLIVFSIIWIYTTRDPQVIYPENAVKKQEEINTLFNTLAHSSQFFFCAIADIDDDWDEFMPDIKIFSPFKSNIKAISFAYPKQKYYFIFLPDACLFINGNKLFFIKYDDISFNGDTIDGYWGEDTTDSLLVSGRWAYAKKDGTPDGRHKTNWLVREYRYGIITMSCMGDPRIRFYFSNPYIVTSELTELRKIGFKTSL